MEYYLFKFFSISSFPPCIYTSCKLHMPGLLFGKSLCTMESKSLGGRARNLISTAGRVYLDDGRAAGWLLHHLRQRMVRGCDILYFVGERALVYRKEHDWWKWQDPLPYLAGINSPLKQSSSELCAHYNQIHLCFKWPNYLFYLG